MDMEMPLKFEGQYFGIQTESDFNQCFQNNPLYENYVQQDDSTQQNSKSDFNLQIIEKIKATVNIALTPLQELMKIGRQDNNWYQVSETILKRNLWKTKLIQKRQRAKNRKIVRNCTKVINKNFEVTSINRNEDMKKQKNRLSAQISRDKKKQLFNKLQMQNGELKKTIQELNKNNTQLQNKIKKQQEQIKKKPQKLFKTLLIFLGIIFLFNLFKNISTQRAQKDTQKTLITKIQLTKKEKQFVQAQFKIYGINLPTQFMQPPKAQDFPNKNIILKIIDAKNALF